MDGVDARLRPQAPHSRRQSIEGRAFEGRCLAGNSAHRKNNNGSKRCATDWPLRKSSTLSALV